MPTIFVGYQEPVGGQIYWKREEYQSAQTSITLLVATVHGAGSKLCVIIRSMMGTVLAVDRFVQLDSTVAPEKTR